MKPTIHQTAVIDEPSTIGEGSHIWHFCHLMPGCTIGKNCTLGQNVYVASKVVIGDRVKIQNNVSLYDGVHIEDDVFIGPSAVFTNVKNPRAHRNQQNHFAATLIKKGATIGANATIVCGHKIGAHAFIAAGAVVTEDVPDHAFMLGVPAIQKGWACKCGERLDNSNHCASCRWQLEL